MATTLFELPPRPPSPAGGPGSAATLGHRPPCAAAPLASQLPVPFGVACLSLEKRALGPSTAVTLMMRNIPSRCTSMHLVGTIEASGFAGTFEFLYLPTKAPKHTQNRGYAFVGFRDVGQDGAFKTALSGASFDRISNKEIWLEKAMGHRSFAELQAVTRTHAQHTRFGPVLVVCHAAEHAFESNAELEHTRPPGTWLRL